MKHPNSSTAPKTGLAGSRIASNMETAKEQVRKILDVLPDEVSLEDIQYHLYVRQKIEQGLTDAGAERLVSHDDAMRRLDKWRIR